MLLQDFILTRISIGTCGESYLSNDMQRWCVFGNTPTFEKTSILCVSWKKILDVSWKFERKLVNVTLYAIGKPIQKKSATPARSPLSKLRGAETDGTRDSILTPLYPSDEHLRILYGIIYTISTRPIVCYCFDSRYKYIFCFFVSALSFAPEDCPDVRMKQYNEKYL